MLRNLRAGAGVHILTGPEGAAFWLPVSVEVRIDVVPDGFEVKEREAPDMVWALQAVGMSATLARGLVRHYGEDKGPTARAATYDRWQQATELLTRFNTYSEPVQSIVVEAHDITAVTEPAEQLALLDRLENVALDWEWNIDEAVAPLFAPEGLGVATADRTWYFPLICSDFQTPFQHEENIRRRVMATIMRTPTVWHNAKADLGAQWLGAPLDAFGSPLHDTLLMAFVAGELDLALKPLARKLLGRDPLDFPGTMRDLPLEVCRRYGGADARNTYDLFAVLWRKMQERQQTHIYEEIERPLIPLLTDMERYGHPVDMVAAQRFRDELEADEERIRNRFLAEDGLDISSNAQTRELIKRRVGYDPGGVNANALAKIEGEWMDAIIRYRKVRHRRRAFLEKHIGKWIAAGKPSDFRLYTSFTQAGDSDQHETRGFNRAPRSGRLSSKSPDRNPPSALPGAPGGNLMNQPNEGADGGFMEGVPGAKSIFIAPPGHVLWARDAKALEMRIQAARSRDAALIEAVMSKDGPHVDFQNRILRMSGKSLPKVAAKQGNFNAAYGGWRDMLRTILQKQRIFMSDADLDLIVNSHKESYPGYYEYGEQVVEYAKVNGGWSETAFGRRRYEPDIFSADQRTALAAQRSLQNHTIQGTGADMLKIGMRFAVPVLKHYGAHMALQIHDEIEGWCPEDVIEYFEHDLEAQLSLVQLNTPGIVFEYDGGHGRSWRDAKP